MAKEGKPDAQMFQLLSNLLHQVEALTNQEEVELRSKIEALGLEVKKVPSESIQNLDDLEIARELDKLSAKLDDVDDMISSAMASDPQISKLSMIPVVCAMEWILHSKHYSKEVKMSVAVVAIGVGICAVTDVKVNAKSFLWACLAVLPTSLQQIDMSL